MGSIAFVDDSEDSNNIFSIDSGIVPRIGERVSYSCDQIFDEKEWDEDSLKEEKKLHGKEWVVTHVSHEYRRYGIFRMSEIVFVTLKEIV